MCFAERSALCRKCSRRRYDLLFRWFVGIGVDDAAWDHSVFSKNRDRLLEGDIAAKFLAAVLAQPKVKKLLSSDHFSVDGTLIEAWASMKSVKPKDGSGEPPAQGGGRNAEADFRQGDEAVLHRAWADGEPPRPANRRLPDAGRRACRAGGRAAHDRASCRPTPVAIFAFGSNSGNSSAGYPLAVGTRLRHR